jgi:signal transduction histidine kinase
MNLLGLTRRNSQGRDARSVRISQRRASMSASEPARLEDILVTHKLKSHRRRRPNSSDEIVTLYTLAKVMASSPIELVDKLLEAALELCSAGTAGLSVLETTLEGEQVFRWTHVAGLLSEHVGDSTQRNFSPCGTTLDRKSPQLFAYPGRRFQYLNGLDFTMVEALVVPVYLGDKIPGTIWVVSHDEELKFDCGDVRVMTGLAEFAGCALRLMRSCESGKDTHLEENQEIAMHLRTERSLRETQAGLQADIRVRNAQLQQLSIELIHAQDEERRRLARELHDSAGQYLAGIQMNLSALLRADSGLAVPARSLASDSMSLADRCSSEIRTMSYLLHPPLLDELGLRAATSMYVEGFAQRSAIRVDLDISQNLGRLPSDIETALFRVIQQGLANVHRHSGSRVAKVCIKSDAGSVTASISDEGCGIPAETQRGFHSGTKLAGVGVAGMRERIKSMGGQFDITSNEGGTKIDVCVPLHARSKTASA